MTAYTLLEVLQNLEQRVILKGPALKHSVRDRDTRSGGVPPGRWVNAGQHSLQTLCNRRAVLIVAVPADNIQSLTIRSGLHPTLGLIQLPY